MPDVSRSGSAIVMPTNQFATQDYEAGKFTLTNGTVAVNTTNIAQNAGEDLDNDVQKVEQRFSYAFSSAVGTTVIKSGAGVVHGVLLSSPSAGGVFTLYDSATGTSTTIVAQFGTTTPIGFYPLDVATATGISVANVGTQTYTVSYR